MFANSIVHSHAQRGAHIRCSALGRSISRSSKGSRLPFGWFKAKNRQIVVNDHRTEYHNPSNGTQQREIVLKVHFFCSELMYGILQRLFVGIEEIQHCGHAKDNAGFFGRAMPIFCAVPAHSFL